MEAVSYGYVYVAQVALGGNDSHVIKAFQEAEAHEGPSIIIAYSSCIAHGYDLVHGLEQQKLAVQSGYWPLMRYNPALRETGKNPFQLDSKAPSIRLKDYAYREARYTMLARGNPELAADLLKEAQDDVERQWRVYSARAAMPGRGETPHIAPEEKPAEKLEPVAAGGTRMIDLTTNYLGLKLNGPIVVSSTPLSESSENVRRMEDAGASAIVLTSLFEEQLALESRPSTRICPAVRNPLPSRSAICPN